MRRTNALRVAVLIGSLLMVVGSIRAAAALEDMTAITVRYSPTETQIESIPVSAIDASWTHVLILRKENQPPNILKEVEAAELYGATFEVTADFDGDRADDRALVGVYRTTQGTFGSFLLILTRSGPHGWRPSFTCSFPGVPGFRILFRRQTQLSGRPHLLVATCMACDVFGIVYWDQGYQIRGSGGPRGDPFPITCGK